MLVVLLIGVGPVVLHVDLELHRRFLFQQTRQAVPLLNRQRQLRNCALRLVLAIRAPALHEDSSPTLSLPAVIDRSDGLFFGKKLIEVALELLASLLILWTKRRPFARQFIIRNICQ